MYTVGTVHPLESANMYIVLQSVYSVVTQYSHFICGNT